MRNAILILLLALVANAAQPVLKSHNFTCSPVVQPDWPNQVIVVYKSTSLGTVFTPFKPTAIFPATRTNTVIPLFPGTYKFYATTKSGTNESVPSETITFIANP